MSCNLSIKDIAPRLSVFIETAHDLAVALRFGIPSVILAPQDVSLSGSLPLDATCELIAQASAAQVECELLLDFLPFDTDFPRALEVAHRCVAAGITLVRVQNIGLAMELRQRFASLQLLFETKSGGNHAGYYREMEQIGFHGAFVSRELNWETICALAPMVSEKFILQLQLFGRLQIFHSARNLVSTLSEETSVTLREVSRPDERFLLHRAGTGAVLYHSHLLDLVPHIPTFFRSQTRFHFLVDHRGVASLETVLAYLLRGGECPALHGWKRSDFRFFEPSSVATEEGTSSHLSTANAHIVAISRNEYVIVEVVTVLRQGECYRVETPEQKVFRATLSEMRTWWGEPLEQATQGEFVRLHWFKGATVGARLTATQGASR